jgi:hypothetical protein
LFEFEAVEGRRVEARFDGGEITSDAGALLLGKLDRDLGLLSRFAACFRDRRDPRLVEHEVASLVGQRVIGIALGYEDLIDHDELRHDRVFHVLAGKLTAERSDCTPVAGKSTLQRLEHGGHTGKYHKIDHDPAQIAALFVDQYLSAHDKPPRRIVLDLDATDDPVHGAQEGGWFHGYYDCRCYLPLYVFCGDHLLAATLRPGNAGPSDGALEEVERIVGQIRATWPRVKIVVRGDSAFSTDELMGWCEDNGVDYVFGLARNERLEAVLAPDMARAAARCAATGEAARVYRDFAYQTVRSWRQPRRVVGKAEQLPGRANPRFVVTSLARDRIAAKPLYEREYCARGEMENRIKEQQLDLFADRTSTATMPANQLRLWFASLAYVLLAELRRRALRHRQFAKATVGTIRLKLLKIAALVRVSVRRVYFALNSSCPYKDDFALAYAYLG